MNQSQSPSARPPRSHDADEAGLADAAAVPPAESALASAVWELMSDFVHGHDPADELRRALGLGRGAGRIRALVSLASGSLSLADLAQAIGADASYTTIIVNELHALGLLSRTQDARDRRRKTVELTTEGREAVRKAQDIIARPPSPLRELPVDDLTGLYSTLDRLSRS
jgi:DNA-binding MarR family transcriptional regulator